MYKDSKPRRENSFKNLTIFPASASNPYTRVKFLGQSQTSFSQTQLDHSFTKDCNEIIRLQIQFHQKNLDYTATNKLNVYDIHLSSSVILKTTHYKSLGILVMNNVDSGEAVVEVLVETDHLVEGEVSDGNN